jgi:hypothetical protein
MTYAGSPMFYHSSQLVPYWFLSTLLVFLVQPTAHVDFRREFDFRLALFSISKRCIVNEPKERKVKSWWKMREVDFAFCRL